MTPATQQANGRPDPRAPYADQRREFILAALRANGRADAADMALELGVTNETVRKDLVALEQLGLLRRVHGGAIPVGRLSYEPPVTARTTLSEEKELIARAALQHLPDNGSVLVDGGSTTAKLAEILPRDRALRIYTNTLSIATALMDAPLLTVYTLGGRVRPVTSAEVDGWAARALAEINVDVAFLGTTAVSLERGLTTHDPSEAAIKRLMLSSARRRILLADHSKFGKVSNCKHADLADIDLLITDAGINPEMLESLRSTGLGIEAV
ncbi:DeoR/GlpR family DNA-binding transcription regulator [Paenarthrobacter aurescens]|uniref:Lactose phosphotransferase system repressor n=1 Tax=Paenarthrobacter aurescens (strain TC1) TaxID=290340 RepID=A1R1P4_PAEAT|nr:DeoR/GlpR family DNA-binding transcription regulator [Paenarthrobacter aurescens]ABM10004.1 putative transcriptional regulator, DeoR family [Paenarthrobacter aurescens TC1]